MPPLQLSESERVRLLSPPKGVARMVLDTDTFNEVDDQFALVQTLLSPDRLFVEAIYAAPFANTRAATPGEGMERSYDEIMRLLQLMDRSAEGLVYHGVRDYVGPAKQAQSGEAVDDLVRRARAGTPDDPLYVVAIAAISNVASALIKAPDIIDRTVVVWLGGHALHWPHTSEFNLRQDVGGAQVLFDCGVPVVQVACLGATSHLKTTVPEIDRYVQPHGPVGEFLARRFREYREDQFARSKELWDMAAVAWLLDESWTPSVLVPTPILTGQLTWSFDSGRHLMRSVRHVERDPILRDFFLKIADFAKRG